MANAMFAMFEPLPLSGDEDEADVCDCGEECAAMKRRRARKRRAAPVPRKTPALVPLDADGDLEPQRREVRARSARVVVEPTRGDYLRTPLRLLPDRILDGSGRAVMMRWEEPIMRAHADTLRCAGADVLNIGFGMGLIDGAISDAAPRSHTIVEAHPDILAAMRSAGWTARATIVDGRWQAPPTQQHAGPATACDPGPTAQERLCDLGTYDAIFYDTFDEGLDTFDLFCSALPALLRPGGTFSWFNGFGGHSARAHSAASERAARLLDAIGCAISLSRALRVTLTAHRPAPMRWCSPSPPGRPRRRGAGSSAATSSCRSRRRRPTSGRACAGGTTRSMRTCCPPPRGLTEHLSRGRA